MPVETKWFFSRFNLIECLGILLISILGSSLVLADQPQVGRKAAQKYFAEDAARASSRESVGENILMIHIGQYTDSEAYQWGPTTPIYGSGQANYGLTYLIDEWHSFDANLRADFSEYSLAGNTLDVKVINPYLDSKVTVYMDPTAFGPSTNIENRITLGKQVNYNTRVNFYATTNDGIATLEFIRTFRGSMSANFVTSTFFNETGASLRQTVVAVGFSNAF